MKYILSLVLIGTLITAFSQSTGNLRYHQTTPEGQQAHAVINDGQITLTINGLLNARADTFVAFFHITRSARPLLKQTHS